VNLSKYATSPGENMAAFVCSKNSPKKKKKQKGLCTCLSGQWLFEAIFWFFCIFFLREMLGKLVLVLLLLAGFASSASVVYRNVKDFGAKGDGNTDDSNAIITALTQGRGNNPNSVYPNAQYSSSTQHPAYVFFPPGTYLVTQTLPVVYYTQMVLFLTLSSFSFLNFQLYINFSFVLLISYLIVRWETRATPQQSSSSLTKVYEYLK
jgi:hypothetical protein